MENGVSHPPDKVGPRHLVNRVEYLRLIQQALHKLGYVEVAKHLEKESVFFYAPRARTLIRDQHGLVVGNLRGTVAAAEQEGFCTVYHYKPMTHAVMHSMQGADGLAGGILHVLNISQLLQQLQTKLPPTLMIPDGRLEQLLEQALLAQVSKCQYHNAIETDLSLFSDYHAGIESLPTHASQVLEAHTDEVWHIAFSHNGQMLASASKDCTTIIWAVRPTGTVSPVHTLAGHDKSVDFLSWSPDDRMLLTCSDQSVRLWDAASGQLLHTYSGHREQVTSVAWLPDSQCFFSGSLDKNVLVNDISGAELQRIKRPTRVQDLAVSASGTVLIIATNEAVGQLGQIHLLRLSDYREVVLPESAPITSIALSPDSRWLLANLNSHTVHLWSLGEAAQPWPSSMDPTAQDPFDCLPSEYELEYKVNEGKHGRFVLRSGFGGGQSNFVVHGSEDCGVYVFHRDSGDLLFKLEGHSGTVNCVSWNPRNPYMLASASDDRTIRVWMAQAALPAESQRLLQ